MRKGLTGNIDEIICKVAEMETIKPYVLCDGTALTIQLGHRLSEDLDFMMWRKSKKEKPEVKWPAIKSELENKIGEIQNFDIYDFGQVEFVVSNVKFSFFVSDNYSPVAKTVPYLGNIRLADINSILAMKLEVMFRRSKMRDYYDIYAILKEGYDIAEGIKSASNYSRHHFKTKNIVMFLLSDKFEDDINFNLLKPKFNVTREEMRLFISRKLKEANLI